MNGRCSIGHAKEIIRELFSDGKNHSIKKIRASVSQTHCDRGGLPPTDRFVKSALISLKKLGEAENLVKSYWRISDNLVPLEYKYEDIPLNSQIVSEIICELFSGQEIETRNIRDEVLQHHLDRGGENVLYDENASYDKVASCVKFALYDLSKKRIASNNTFAKKTADFMRTTKFLSTIQRNYHVPTEYPQTPLTSGRTINTSSLAS